ncbi:glycosyltransferase [Microvirga alba]|uniref:Glycosyltransferase n=1 Tax=Microvirga alba TaxID=2791025 RepID=A0A931BNS8_9HYPH|nr:glycosyltransferase [Microvirga alba]MBF9231989.1 glycosyltransferase [Microvirga alba]
MRRHGDALHEIGWTVSAVGYPARSAPVPDWTIVDTVPDLLEQGDTDRSPDRDERREVEEQIAAARRRASQAKKELILSRASDLRSACAAAGGAVSRGRATISHGVPLLGVLIPYAAAFAYWRVRGFGGEVRGGFVSLLKPVTRRLFSLRRRAEHAVLKCLGVHRIAPEVTSWQEFKPYLSLLQAHVDSKRALEIYWSWPTVTEMYAKARTIDTDLWVANDWITLPIVAKLVEEKGGSYIYDSHEFGTQEYPNDPRWRAFTQPIARAVERRFIRDAKFRFSVSPGISKELTALYRLDVPCAVIRNMPHRQDPVFRPTGEKVRVLYHGIVAEERGLEAAIESVGSWRPEFSLTIRGPGHPDYIARLASLIRSAGVSDRVEIAPPVPVTELVRAAKEFDIGFFALPDNSLHNQFALPNKFFEYVNSGLALCVTNCPDMAELTRRHDLGVLIDSMRPESIAAAINGLDRVLIDRYKQNAIRASETLCWQSERWKLVDACKIGIAAAHTPLAARTD